MKTILRLFVRLTLPVFPISAYKILNVTLSMKYEQLSTVKLAVKKPFKTYAFHRRKEGESEIYEINIS